ncbi:MAG TPA: hypothetical protein VIL09_08190 [Microvirga sp.]|jgi:hypothetical protein
MFRFAVGIALGAAVLCGPAEARDCIVPAYYALDNQTIDTNIKVKANKFCRIAMSRGIGGLRDPRITKQARFGAAAINGFAVVYRPKSGFVGTDSFTYARENWDRWGNKAVRTVNVTVEVTP